MATQTIDLPAYGCIAPYSGTRVDTLATPDTATEITIGDVFQPIAVGTYGGGYDPGALVDLSSLPVGANVTDVRYVVIAYRDSVVDDPSYDPGSGYTPTPTSQPFLYLSSSARTQRFAFDDLPVGGYAGEMVSEGVESLSQLQLGYPLNRAVFGSNLSTGPTIHVAYLAIRVTYELSPCYQTLAIDGLPGTADIADSAYGTVESYAGRTMLDLTVSLTASATGSVDSVPLNVILSRGGHRIDVFGGSKVGPAAVGNDQPFNFLIPPDGIERDYSATIRAANLDYNGWGSLADVQVDLEAGMDAEFYADLDVGSGASVNVAAASLRVGHKCVVNAPMLRQHPNPIRQGRLWPRPRRGPTGIR